MVGIVMLNLPPVLLGGQGDSPLLLRIMRPVDPGIIEHQRRTELAFQEYDALDRNRGSLQITFALVFAIATLLVPLGAALIGAYARHPDRRGHRAADLGGRSGAQRRSVGAGGGRARG